MNSELGSLGAQKCSKKPKGRALIASGVREGRQGIEKLEKKRVGSRKQKSRFQLRAPRAAAASSRLPDFPPRPAPPRPSRELGPECLVG